MSYEQKTLRRQKVRYNSNNADNKIEFQLMVDGAKVTPDSGAGDVHSITIYAPGNATALIDQEDMTVSGTKLTYQVDTEETSNWPIASGYRAEIEVIYNDVTYKRHLIFDVVRFLLETGIGFDQLVAYDDSIQGMEHSGDDDFSELIEACRDHLQAKIETKILGDNRLIENAIIDSSLVAVCHRLYCLWRIHMNKQNYDAAKDYRAEFESMWGAVINSIKYDKSQDGEEDAEVGGVQEVRLVT